MTQEPVRTYGVLRMRPEDYERVRSFIPRALNFPDTCDLRPMLQPVRDQGSQGACVAFATSCVLEYFMRKQNNDRAYMSPQFFYNNRQNTGEGMYMDNAASIASRTGICLERTYPYGTVESAARIRQDVYAEAAKFKMHNPQRVKSITALKSAISTVGPCVVSFPVYDHSGSFWRDKGTAKLLGGHAVAVVGYDNKKGFLLRNSWGGDWGDQKNGYAWWPLSEWHSHWEIFSYQPGDYPDVADDPQPQPKCCAGCKCTIL